MGRKTHTDRPTKRTSADEIHGTKIAMMPTDALLFWLAHFTAGTPTRKALLEEIDGRFAE